jgi:hypothetical protein
MRMNFRFHQFVCRIFAIFCVFPARSKIRPTASARDENGLLAVRPAPRALRVLLRNGGILLRGDELGHDTSMDWPTIVALVL